MRVLAEETVVRYHVEYDEAETLVLKRIGFLPPYAEPRARLWSTQAEIDSTTEMLRRGIGPFDEEEVALLRSFGVTTAEIEIDVTAEMRAKAKEHLP